jgi:3-dehydroquinate synthetase
MQLDKKAGTEGLKLILLKQIGEGIITAAPNDSILKSVIDAKTII